MVQLGQDHDTGATVEGAAIGGIILSDGQVFAATSGGNMGGLEAIFVLEDTDNGSSALYAKVPVVQQVAPAKVYVVGVALDHEFDIGLRL